MIRTARTPRFSSLGARALAVALAITLASSLVLPGASAAHCAAPALATGTVRNAVISTGIGNAWVRAFFYDPVDNDWKYAAATCTAGNGSHSISTG